MHIAQETISDNFIFDRICNSVDELINECAKNKNGLKDDYVRQLYEHVQNELTNSSKEVQWEGILHRLFGEYSNKLIALNSRLHCESEKEIAVSLVTGYRDYKDANLWITDGFRMTISSVMEVIETSELLTEPYRVCVVGGGAFPQSHILISQNTQATVTTIERDVESANLCREVLKKYNLNNANVICIEGEKANYSSYDVVIVATLVENKAAIFERLISSHFSGILVMRRPCRLHSLWRENASFNKVCE